jgi:hypothetical protein
MHIHTNVVSLFPPGTVAAPAVETDLSRLSRPVSAAPSADVPVAEIARRLGLASETWRTIIAKIRLLNRRYGFPAPRNPRFVKGELVTGPDAIVRRSLFPRARVEEWFDNHRGPAQALADDAAEAKAATATLASNTRNLVAQLGHGKAAASC